MHANFTSMFKIIYKIHITIAQNKHSIYKMIFQYKIVKDSHDRIENTMTNWLLFE